MEGDFIKFIPEHLLILVAGLYVMGIFFKKMEYIKDNLIPLLLMAMALIFSCLLSKELSPLALLQGILCWGASIGINQFAKQTFGEK